jgi:hypothetical protein
MGPDLAKRISILIVIAGLIVFFDKTNRDVGYSGILNKMLEDSKNNGVFR